MMLINSASQALINCVVTEDSLAHLIVSFSEVSVCFCLSNDVFFFSFTGFLYHFFLFFSFPFLHSLSFFSISRNALRPGDSLCLYSLGLFPKTDRRLLQLLLWVLLHVCSHSLTYKKNINFIEKNLFINSL